MDRLFDLLLTTPWFWVLGAVGLLVLLSGIYYQRLAALQHRNLELEAQLAQQAKAFDEKGERLSLSPKRAGASPAVSVTPQQAPVAPPSHPAPAWLDEIAQLIGALDVQAKSLQSTLTPSQNEPALAAVAQLSMLAQRADDAVGRHILGVPPHPPTSPQDFLTILAEYLHYQEQTAQFHPQVDWPDEPFESPLAPEVGRQLLWIIHEGLSYLRDALPQAQAQLHLTLDGDGIQVVLAASRQSKTQGLGHPPGGPKREQSDASAAQAHPPIPDADHDFDLALMRERAEAVGGRLTIQSQSEQGISINVWMPCLVPNTVPHQHRPLRVMLVDDHPLYLQGLQTLLSTQNIEVVGVAHDGLEAQALVTHLQPDLILMDIEMPHCNGLEATRHIKAAYPAIKIVILTVAAEDERLLEALKSGASGYLLKSLKGTQLFTMLDNAVRGEIVLSPGLATRVLNEFTRQSGEPEPAVGSAESTLENTALTLRQYEVLKLAAQGHSNKEIAGMLHISENTVKYHIRQILDRLQLRNRSQLIRYAYEQRVMILPDD